MMVTALGTPTPESLRRLAENSSATANLDAVLNFITLNPPLRLSVSLKVRFGIIAGFMFLMGFLYVIRLVQAFLVRDYRVVERNKNGYLNPNVEVLIPSFAIANNTLGMCSIISMKHDDGRYISRLTLLSQVLSYAFLFFCAVTRVWKTLSIIPTVPVQVTPFRRNLLTSGLPPSWFNALVIVVYISFPVVTLPLALKVANRVAKLGKESFELLPYAKVIVAQYQNALPGDTTVAASMEEVVITLQSKQKLIQELALWWKLTCVAYLAYCMSLFIAFSYASAKLYSTLTCQIQNLSRARRRFARMADAGVRSLDDEAPIDASQSASLLSQGEKLLQPFTKLKESIWAQSHNECEILQLWDPLESCTENAEFVRKFKLSIRYRQVVWWQWLGTSMEFTAFLILAFCLTVDVFSNHGIPHVKRIIIIHEWAGWAWALPGSALAFLACCVAFMPHSDLRTEPCMLPRYSLHKGLSRGQRFQVDLPRTSTETDAVKLRSYTTFLPETPPSSKVTVLSEVRFTGCKMWRKFEITKPNPTLSVSQRARKFSIFSLAEDVTTEEKEAQLELCTQIHQEPLGGPPCARSLKGESDAASNSQVESDVNIIKSLRDRDS